MSAEQRDSTGPGTSAAGTIVGWLVIALLLGVLVAGLVVSATIVFARGAGSGLGDRVSSLSDPPTDVAKEQELALAAARTFVQRFNSYGPDLLDEAGKMPKYAAVGELMTTKFAKVFADNVGYAEQTVAETKIERKATVHAVGIGSLDQDSAMLLVGGIVEFSYPDPDNTGERVPFEPLRFRYEVSLVKQDGRWLVDDLDDVDDDLPSFGDAADAPRTTPSEAPTSGAPSGETPGTEAPSTPSGTPEGSASP